MVLEGGIAREQALAKDAFEGFELHVDTLRMVLKMADGFEGFSTVSVRATEWSDAFCMGQKMILQVLLLLERLVTAFESAHELALMALEVPVKLALADELLVGANRTLEL